MARDVRWWLRESAVRIGALWVPGRQVETTLGRFTKQLFCLNHHDQYPYSFLGSATALRIRDRCFLIWCRHQTKDYRPDDVTIPIDGGKTLISGSRFLYIEIDSSNKDEDFTDLCAMEFVPANYGSPNLVEHRSKNNPEQQTARGEITYSHVRLVYRTRSGGRDSGSGAPCSWHIVTNRACRQWILSGHDNVSPATPVGAEPGTTQEDVIHQGEGTSNAKTVKMISRLWSDGLPNT
jgi:hypothetical protein